MADQKRPKNPKGQPPKDEPFRPISPSNSEATSVGSTSVSFEDPIDLSELDGLIDDAALEAPDAIGSPFVDGEPLPPLEESTDSHALLGADLLDDSSNLDLTRPGGEDSLDAGTWDLPNLDEALEPPREVRVVSDVPMPTVDRKAEREAARREEEARRAAEAEARRAEEARIAEETRRAEDARVAEEARIAEEARVAEEVRLEEEAREARQAEEARRAEELRLAEEARLAEEVRREEEEREAEEARRERQAKKAEAPKKSEPVAKSEPAKSEPAPRSDPEGASTVPAEFRRESQRLARARDWKKLTELTLGALGESWATAPELRATLLADLGRIQRDRLGDAAAAEKTFAELVRIEPAHVDGFAFLADAYEERGAWRPLYDLHLAAVEATWDPNERLAWTRRAVQIAEEHLMSAELSLEAWERLAKLGDAVEETTRALTDGYRAAGRWDRLTDFLERSAEQMEGAERRLQLREVAEACLAGLRDAERAAQVLERLLADRPDDPISLLMLARVEARRHRWDSLFVLGTRPTLKTANGAPDPITTNDLRRIAADALAAGGEHERAARIYDLVLSERPGDKDAIEAKERYLAQSGRVAELVDFLAERAGKAEEKERAQLLERAAEIAERDLKKPERAIQLWEARAEVATGRLDALRALANLHETMGNDDGLRHALEGQLRLVHSTSQRIELLRRLGRHAAHRLSDDGLAERCWSEILRAVPDDREVRDELVALFRRRGDFAALDRAFDAQAWRPLADEERRGLWRSAAENVEQNLNDASRATAAWRRVLDLSPDDGDALAALVRQARASQGDGRALILALEAQLRALGPSAPTEHRVAITLEIAACWEALNDTAAAAAAFERVLWWSAGDATAIARLLAIRPGLEKSGDTKAATSAALLDRAALEVPTGSERHLSLLREQIELVPKADALGRFYAWRRLYRVAGPSPEIVAELTAAANAAGAYRELEAVLVDLAARSADADERRAHHATLAVLYEKRLNDPLRALLAITSARQERVAGLAELDEAFKLCDVTGRHEDAYALLGVAARADASPQVRTDAIRCRAALAEQKLNDPERAFHEHVRVLVADPHDADALAAAQRIAGAQKLGRALDALYGELRDRAESNQERGRITRLRFELRTGALGDAAGALDELWLLYRLQPNEAHEALLLDVAAAQGRWARGLAVVEARVRAGVGGAGLAQLDRLAKLHENERNDQERALELSAAALVESTDPEQQRTLEATIERLASATQQWSWQAEAFRAAAARAGDPARALSLYRRVAAVNGERLNRAEQALDAHRRILQLDPNDLTSLEVAIQHLRSAELWRELRDTLQHWLEVAPDADKQIRVERQLLVGAISRDRLGDPDRALSTFAAVLETDPKSEAAAEGITSLTGGAMTPELEARRLRLELARAQAPRRVELMLALVALQEEKLEDRKAAIVTLRELVAETGAAGPGYAPLKRLLEKEAAWVDVVELLEAHAQACEGPAREQALDDALTLAEARAAEVGTERQERLCRRLVETRPNDTEARRRLHSLLRETGRWEELADRLEDQLRRLGDPDDDTEELREERGLIESELVHLLERKLGKPGDAGALLLAQMERRPERPDAILELAGLRLRQGDVAGYLNLRQEHARQLGPSLGAYVLCHLAEATDEKLGDQAKVLDLYRAARTLDATNPAAMDALKAVGRRAKSWRSSAALLPDPDERELAWPERSRRLLQRAAAARGTDVAAARMWLERAIATDPDNHEAWTALAELARLRHDLEEDLTATRAALCAFMRSSAADPARQAEHAHLLLAYADARRARGDAALAARLAWRAYEVRPTLPAAALQVGAELLAHDRSRDAYAIYDRLLGAPDTLAPRERLEATFRRGALRAAEGNPDAAIADFREGLRIEELHPPLLGELAQVLAATGRVANAAVHQLQALLLASERSRRGELYSRLGRLFEGALGDADEGGVCFDRAMLFGSTDPQIMLRALGHYRRKGEVDRALSVIENLVPSTKKPEDLAALWAEKGRLLAERDGDKAVEAFDMALSYDPSCAAAVQGLASVLEARGDWKQLLELLEVRADQGAPAERAVALRGLARIAAGHLDDVRRAEKYLREAIALNAEREDYEQLLKIVGDAPERRAERRDVVAALLAMGGPLMPRVIEMGRELVAEGRRQWAWSLLSPLMNTTLSEPSLKSMVLELRKEFEKAETTGKLSPQTHELVRPTEIAPVLYEVLAEVDAMGVIGPAALDGVTLGKLDGRTAVGKTFLALAERLGLENATLFRAQELPAPFLVLDSDTPQVVLRSDLVQLMAPGETNYLFTLALEHARPGARMIASLPAADRRWLWPAILDVLGIAPAPAEAAALRDRVAAAIPEDRRAALVEKLAKVDRSLLTAPELGARLADAVIETARRVALVAAADLRFPAKVLGRLDDALPKLPSAGKLDDLEEFLAAAAPIRALVSFAASSQFARALDS